MPHPHVLVVAPDFESKSKAAILLFSNGCEAMPASNIKDALDLTRSFKPDLILTAMHLPDGDADHLIHTVKGSSQMGKTPIIAFSKETKEGEGKHILQAGALAYVDLDRDQEQLLRTIKKHLKDNNTSRRKKSVGSITGQLATLRIVDLIRKMVENHGSGIISIDGSLQMKIYLKDGEIVHALHGITVGKKALFRCLLIADAAYHFEPWNEEVEASVQGSLEELLNEARVNNEKLMANSHKLPQSRYRLRLRNLTEQSIATFKPQARAALEIIRKYPRVGAFLDRLNLPDMMCYEYLFTFMERDYLELVTEQKPLKIITDASCSISPSSISSDRLEIIPVELKVGRDLFKMEEAEKIYALKAKVLEGGQPILSEKANTLQLIKDLLPHHDCLVLWASNVLLNLKKSLRQGIDQLNKEGINGKSLLANEFMMINANSVSMGLSLLVEKALTMAEQGMDIDHIEERLLHLISRLYVFFAVQQDKGFLMKKSSEPVILAWDGKDLVEIDRLEKDEDLIECLVKDVRKRLNPKSKLSIAIGHIQAETAAQKLQQSLANVLHQDITIPIRAISPAIGYRLGVGALEIAFLQE